MDTQVTRYCSANSVVRRRRLRSGVSTFNSGVYRRYGLQLAVLLVVDRFRVTGAFGGLAVGVASAIRVGSTGAAVADGGERYERISGGWGDKRRELLRPRCTTLAPTTDAEEERILPKELRSQSGSNEEGSATTSAVLDRGPEVARQEAAHGGRESPAKGTRNGEEQGRRDQQGIPTLNASLPNGGVVSLDKLNSRSVNPALVRQTVLHYLSNARRLTSYQFVCLGMASSRYCDIHVVTNVCETAHSMGVKTNVRFMTNLVNAASKSRRWVMAAQLLQLMRSYGVTPNDVTFTSILSEMSKAKQHHMAAEMLQTEGLQTSLCAYNALISGCTSSRGYERAMGYFNDMIKAGVQPDTMTFSSLIATARDGSETSVKRAFGAMEMMKEAGVKPNTYCMNSLMAVSVQARQPNTALEIFREMERDGIPRDVVSYNTAIAACDKLGDASAAVRLLRQAREASIIPDVFSYNSVISALGHSSLWQEAIQIFEEMHEVGVRPGLMTYNTLIAGCVRAEHPREAISVFKLMEERNIKRDQYSYAGVLHACMHLRDFEMSMALLEEMEKNGMPANAEGYATAIRTCARSGRTEEAVFLYAQSLRLSIVPTKVTYKALLEAFVEAKSGERAAWVLDEMRQMEVQMDHSHLMDVLLACTNETDIALQTLRLNEELDLYAASKMYAKALEVCIAAGDYEASVITVDMMADVGLQPEPDQEKRMLQACRAPSQHGKRDPSQVEGEGQKEESNSSGEEEKAVVVDEER